MLERCWWPGSPVISRRDGWLWAAWFRTVRVESAWVGCQVVGIDQDSQVPVGLRGSTVIAFIGPAVPFPSPARDYRVASMSRSNAEWSEWARRRRVSFEIQPLMEVRGSEKLQVGFALSLYAEAPMDKAPGTERRAAAEALKQELLGFVQEAFPAEERAKTELEPPRTAVLRPENELKPEISLTWRIFHKDEYLKAVTAEDRDGMTGLEKRLSERGLKRGHW